MGHGRAELRTRRAQMSRLAYCSGFVGASNIPSITLADRLLAHRHHAGRLSDLRRRGGERVEFKTAALLTEGARQARQGEDHRPRSGTPRSHAQTMSATGMGRGYWKMFEPRVPGSCTF